MRLNGSHRGNPAACAAAQSITDVFGRQIAVPKHRAQRGEFIDNGSVDPSVLPRRKHIVLQTALLDL
jgi:hypothetical protein